MASSSSQPSPVSPAPRGNAAFNNAYRSFYDSLPEKERALIAPCASPEKLINGLENLNHLVKLKKKKKLFLARISNFAESLQPYLNIVDIMVQSNPEFAALIWGSLRLLFQLASNFSIYFEKLLTLLTNLSVFFPQYHEIGKFCEQSSFTGNLRSYVENVYIDFFKLFRAIARIFTSADGKLRRTPAVIGDLLWKPFDARFEEFIGHFRNHKKLIGMEIQNIQVQMISKTVPLMEEEQILNKEARRSIHRLEEMALENSKVCTEYSADVALKDIKCWLSPPIQFEEIFHEAQNLCEDGTNNWILINSKFSEWSNMQWEKRSSKNKRKLGQNSLWIQGKPGSGKTILAASIIQSLRTDAFLPPPVSDVYYYFFDSRTQGDSTTTATALRSILAQIIHHHKREQAILDKFIFLRTALSEGSAIADSTQLDDLIKMFFSSLNAFLVLDGIDECQDNYKLVELLLWLSENTTTKILLLSRPNVVSLATRVLQSGRLVISKDNTQPDISTYLTTQITLLVEEDYFPSETRVEILISHLLNGADGMFLWARLMVGFLKSPALTPSQRLRAINEVILPEGLDIMYQRVVKLIEQAGPTQFDLAKRTIEWIIDSTRALTLDELHEALVCDYELSSLDQSAKFKNLEDSISIITGGLVEPYVSSNQNSSDKGFCFRLIHLSAKEFFQSDREKLGNGFLLPRTVAQLRICRKCVRCIFQQTPKEIPKSCAEIKNALPSNLTLTGYATQNWIQHFCEMVSMPLSLDILYRVEFLLDLENILETLSNFISEPLAVTGWLETFFRLSHTSVLSKKLLYPVPGSRSLSQWAKHLADGADGAYVAKDTEIYTSVAEKSERLAGLMATFEENVLNIISDWGDKLESDPNILWDEVPAFTKSSFLANRVETKVTSMVPKNLENNTLSNAKALSVISKSGIISQIGNATAVLSIWPSTSSQKAWQQSQPVSYEDCERWIAHYEVWRHGQNSDRLIDIRIPLNNDEIWRQILQSFRQRWGELEMSFPVTIGESLLCFTVLRTVFKLQLNLVGKDIVLHSVVVPMDFSDDANPFWTLPCLNTSWVYTYNFRLSSDDRYIIFSDSARNLELGDEDISRIAIFEIELLNILCIKFLGMGPVENLDLLQDTLFHPTYPFVLLVYHDGVKIWHLKHGPHNVQYLWKRSKGEWWNGEVRFSSCGKFLLIAGSKDPVSLLRKDCFNKSNLTVDSIEEHPLPSKSGPIGNSYSSLISSNSPPIIGSDGSHTLASETASRALVVEDQNTITLKPLGSADNKAFLHLLSIPRWSHYEKRTTTVFAPIEDSSSISIVMDKSAENGIIWSKSGTRIFPSL